MGLLTHTSDSLGKGLKSLPAGCFTVDRDGRVISSTLPQSFSAEMVRQIAKTVLLVFENAHQAQLIFNEIQVVFPAMKLTARELRGGAIIFLAPSPPTQLGSLNDTSAI